MNIFIDPLDPYIYIYSDKSFILSLSTAFRPFVRTQFFFQPFGLAAIFWLKTAMVSHFSLRNCPSPLTYLVYSSI